MGSKLTPIDPLCPRKPCSEAECELGVVGHLSRGRDGGRRRVSRQGNRGFVLYAFNKGEVCTAPSRALIQETIYAKFMERVLERVRANKHGNPLDPATMMGPQVSAAQLEKIES